MKINAYLSFLVMLMAACMGRSVDEFPELRGPYLGQDPPGTTAQKFAPGIVSTSDHEHSRMVLSRDGREMYWAVVRGEEQGIWVTRNEGGQWSKPAPLPLSFRETRAPEIGPEGTLFYFFTDDPGADPREVPRRYQLWARSMTDPDWDHIKPVADLIPQVPNMMTMSFSLAANRNLYFDLGGPDENGKWSWRIYFSEFRNGRYAGPVPLGEKINEGSFTQFPFVAGDEEYLIFSSRREGNLGDGDLYISFKGNTGDWLDPVNMGARINTSAQERSPSVTPDGKYLFFTRHDRETLQDFYWIDAEVIDELRPPASNR